MQTQELERRIAAFPRWHYRFQFEGGIVTPVAHSGQINRHEQRRRYFFEALLQVMGGSLRGQRVLDLGCNAGLWSLLAVEAGANFVLGLDVHRPYIEQAELVFEAKGIECSRYRFEQADIFEQRSADCFDVVLCLGVMEVTAKPVELFELFAGVAARVLVIDTVVSPGRSSYFEVSKVDQPHDPVEQSLVLVPTVAAVLDLARAFGWEAVALARNMTDYSGMDDYRQHRRVAFLCAKDASLDALPSAPADRELPWRWIDPQKLRRARRRRGV